MITLNQESPSSGPWTSIGPGLLGMGPTGVSFNVMQLNHPETIPPTPSIENCLPRNQSLVPKRFSINDHHDEVNMSCVFLGGESSQPGIHRRVF